MFMPKEIAPYMGTIAPLIAPISLTASLALGQLGSAKMNDGKLDPYTAAASFMAGNTPQARQTRMAGRIDPSQGNMGQRLSGRFSDYLSGTGLNESSLGRGIIRGIDPTQSMSMLTSGGPGNYYESPALSKAHANFNKSGTEIGLPSEKIEQVPGIDYAFSDNNNLIGKSLDYTGKSGDLLEADMATRYGEIATIDNLTAAENKTLEKYKAFDVKNGTNTADSYIEKLGRRKMDLGPIDGSKKFFNDAIEGVSEFAMPGFTDADGFNFAKAVTTIGTTTTLGNMMAIAEELEKSKIEDREKEQKIYRDWFEQYKKVTGRDYADSPYPDDVLMKQYKNIYNATGGRIGYNIGGSTGIIAAAPGMPQGMQLDGRDGMFISQGVEEKADDVPAMLSKNEFVLTADAMAGLDKINGGSGDPRAAAKQMYQIMDQLEAMA